MSDKQFVTGMRFERPSDKAPEWIRGRISVKVSDFIAWAQANQNERGWVNIDLKVSKNGNLYLEKNTYQKTADLKDVAHKESYVPDINEPVDDIPW